MIRSNRRRFLAGMGGLLVALPFLEGLERPTLADTMDRRFLLNFRQWFGVQQKPRFGGTYRDEVERFWPNASVDPGGKVALTRQLLEKTDGGGELRATGELADFASSLLILRGVRVMDLNGLHRPHLVQVMTGSTWQKTRPGFDPGDDNNAWPLHETLDALFARSLNAPKPLVFEAVQDGDSQTSFENGKDGAIPSMISPMRHPSEAYAKLFLTKQLEGKEAALRLRASDAILAELKSLRADPRLSSEDRRRLDAHFDAMNEVETKLQCLPPDINDASMVALRDADKPKLSDASKARWEAVGLYNEYVDSASDAFLQIAALGVACGAFRAANIVMSPQTNFNRSTVFDENGSEFSQGFPGHYHALSHRAFSHDGQNDDADNSEPEKGALAHHRIDRWHARKFAKLLGLLRDADVLDQGVTMWTNENATGDHWAYDMPYIIAGSAGGKLRTGQLMDLQSGGVDPGDTVDDGAIRNAAMAKQMPCSRVLNSVGAALGLTNDDKSPLSEFGGFQGNLPRITGNLPSLLT